MPNKKAGDLPKSKTALVHSKDEILFPESIHFTDDINVCGTTGSAAEIGVIVDGELMNYHLTDVQLIKLFENLKLSRLVVNL